jgi:hypothetical protein
MTDTQLLVVPRSMPMILPMMTPAFRFVENFKKWLIVQRPVNDSVDDLWITFPTSSDTARFFAAIWLQLP